MSTDVTTEGGHGAVPTGPEVPVEPRAAVSRRDWPLYEVFVRGKRGLNHVHVGSLHAPDDEMAGGLSPFGEDHAFPLPPERLRYAHPQDKPNRAGLMAGEGR